MAARIKFTYTGAGTIETVLGFSPSWTVNTITLETSDTITAIVIGANDDPDSLAAGTYQVYFDFILVCEDVFTFPYVSKGGTSGGVQVEIVNRYADIEIWGRVGDITQYGGMTSPIIRLSGDMDTRTGWGTTPPGEKLYNIVMEAYTDPWQWFTSDVVNCKVTPRRLPIGQEVGSNAQRVWTLDLKQYSLSCGSVAGGSGQFFGI
jgi:hypothetical protein